MEKLFETDIICNFETYKDYSNYIALKEQKLLLKALMIVFLMFAFGLTLYSKYHTLEPIFIFTIAPLAFLLTLFIKLKNGIKKAWNSNKSLQEKNIHYDFYDDHFVMTHEKGTMEIKYDDLYKILDNKKYIYIMIANNQGHILLKENCSNELIKFICDKKRKA